MESGKNIQLLYDVGLRIKELRLENEWKQIELAKRIGVDRTSDVNKRQYRKNLNPARDSSPVLNPIRHKT